MTLLMLMSAEPSLAEHDRGFALGCLFLEINSLGRVRCLHGR
jgi:hypothetical protein